MARIFGFGVTVLWTIFTLMALRAASIHSAADQGDAAFWYLIIGIFLALATGVALVGTLRYRPEGPRKP